MLHHIQKSILDSLATSETLRYSDIKPASLDGNVFGYHLKQVISDGYIVKCDDGTYSLTPRGRNYLVHRYENPLTQAHSILLIVIRRGDAWLMRKRLVQPLLGFSGFVHGEPKAGETIINTASTRLFAKTGITSPLTVHSSGLITITRSGILESYSHAVILTGETDDDYIVSADATGEQHWCTTNEIRTAITNFLPSCLDIISRVEANDRTPFELSYDL